MIVNFYFSIFSCKTLGCKTLSCIKINLKNLIFINGDNGGNGSNGFNHLLSPYKLII